MAVFPDAVGVSNVFTSPNISWPSVAIDWDHPGSGLRRTVVVALSYQVDGGVLTGLQRVVTYNDLAMTSLGVVAWNGAAGAWTEMFGIIGVPGGKRVHASVSGSLFAGRTLRGESLSYTGVGSFGTVVTASGTGTALTMTATAGTADMIVQAFGAQSGLSGYTATQRYINNYAISLAMGDAAGTGSGIAFGATRASSGTWSGLAVPLVASDIVATAKPLAATPIVSASGSRLPRPGIARRTIFNVQPEA